MDKNKSSSFHSKVGKKAKKKDAEAIANIRLLQQTLNPFKVNISAF